METTHIRILSKLNRPLKIAAAVDGVSLMSLASKYIEAGLKNRAENLKHGRTNPGK